MLSLEVNNKSEINDLSQKVLVEVGDDPIHELVVENGPTIDFEEPLDENTTVFRNVVFGREMNAIVDRRGVRFNVAGDAQLSFLVTIVYWIDEEVGEEQVITSGHVMSITRGSGEPMTIAYDKEAGNFGDYQLTEELQGLWESFGPDFVSWEWNKKDQSIVDFVEQGE